MADKPKSTCPADRFNAVLNDPASRAAVNLQAAFLYNRCCHRLRKDPAECALSQAFAEFSPPPASPEFTPPQAFPEFVPFLAYPEIPPSRASPEILPLQVTPEIPPSQASPEIPPSQAFAETPQASPGILPSQASPEFSPSQASPEIYPSRESPDFPSPQVPDKISFPPWFLTEESEGMENCQDMSRPRRSKKPIYRLQVDVNHQTKYTETLIGSQQKTLPSKLPQVFVKLCKISLPQQHSDQADDESDSTTKKKRDLSQSSYKTALSEVSSCLTQKSRPLEILANNNLYESRAKVISEQGDNIDFSEDADQRSISTMGSRKVTREIGENDLLGQQAEMSENNNELLEATGTQSGKNWKQNHYISRWVPVLRKKKLYIEGELLRLDEAPAASDSLYASSKILERFSERRVASKNSSYDLEGPLRIPDPAVRPMPLFVIEKFRNGIPEDWKKVVDVWASFSDHKIIQKSASPSDLARFSQISSETGNICSMTNGSLISSMAADSEGNFLVRSSTPAKEDLQRPKGAFQSEIASVHSQELYPLKEKDEAGVNGAKSKSGKGTSKKGRKMESTPEK